MFFFLPAWRTFGPQQQNESRGHTDLNHGPIGLQPIALPLSYIPSVDLRLQILGPNTVVTAG